MTYRMGVNVMEKKTNCIAKKSNILYSDSRPCIIAYSLRRERIRKS